MNRRIYRYTVAAHVDFADVVATLHLSFVAVQSLHGEACCQLDARFIDDAATRAIIIDASSRVGRAINRIFVGYARREFGDGAMVIERAAEASCSSRRPPVAA